MVLLVVTLDFTLSGARFVCFASVTYGCLVCGPVHLFGRILGSMVGFVLGHFFSVIGLGRISISKLLYSTLGRVKFALIFVVVGVFGRGRGADA